MRGEGCFDHKSIYWLDFQILVCFFGFFLHYLTLLEMLNFSRKENEVI